MPYSAKKLEDFGGDTWLIARAPSALISVGCPLSVYSNRDLYDEPTAGVLLVEELAAETCTGASSGFWS